MGSTIWIDVRGVPGDEVHEDMNVLLALGKWLDAVAIMLGVTPLTRFYDYAYDEDAKPTWFDAKDGFRAVHALRDALELDFTILDWVPDESTPHWPEALLEHLRACERVLEHAVASKRRFRLMIVA
jgi:hypothetical protein